MMSNQAMYYWSLALAYFSVAMGVLAAFAALPWCFVFVLCALSFWNSAGVYKRLDGFRVLGGREPSTSGVRVDTPTITVERLMELVRTLPPRSMRQERNSHLAGIEAIAATLAAGVSLLDGKTASQHTPMKDSPANKPDEPKLNETSSAA